VPRRHSSGARDRNGCYEQHNACIPYSEHLPNPSPQLPADLWSTHMDNSRVTSLSFSPCSRYLALGFWNDAFAVLENVRTHAYRCHPLYTSKMRVLANS
jgi:hypothetical protein